MADLLDQLKNSNRGKVRFLSVKAEVQQALEAGYPQRDVWKVLHDSGRFPLSYSQFNRYVCLYLLGGKKNAKQDKKPPAPAPAAKKGGLPTFTYSATPDDKDDLI